MITEFDYDLFVIGAGSGGVRAARMAASQGKKVAVAEERYLGGPDITLRLSQMILLQPIVDGAVHPLAYF